jgi:hypothetical protein
MTTPDIDPDDLHFGAAAESRSIAWSALEVDDWSYTQTFSFEDTETGVTYTLVTTNGYQVDGVVLYSGVHSLADLLASAEPSDLGVTTDTEVADLVQRLGDVEPYQSGVEGPMMNYWYPCERLSADEAVLATVDLPLCYVEVDGEPGFALTGGGMDLSWEIAEAFVRSGYYPPAFISDLPRMAGLLRTPTNEVILRSLIARDRRLIERLQWHIDGFVRHLESLPTE